MKINLIVDMYYGAPIFVFLVVELLKAKERGVLQDFP